MRILLQAFCLAALVAASACQPPGDTLTVDNPWAAASPNGASVAAGYFTLRNTGDAPDQLVGASSPRAPHVQVHQMRMGSGAMMEMRPLTSLDIPAHGEVTLSPGGYHLMFENITAPFTPGEQVSVTLTFAHHAPITTQLPVRAGMGDGM